MIFLVWTCDTSRPRGRCRGTELYKGSATTGEPIHPDPACQRPVGFLAPNANRSLPTVGRITGTYPSRQIQLRVKVSWSCLASDEDVICVHGAVKALFQDAEANAERGAIAAVVIDGVLHGQPVEEPQTANHERRRPRLDRQQLCLLRIERYRRHRSRTGNPNHKGLPTWPAYATAQRATMVFDAPASKVVNDPGRAERELWASLG